MKSFHASGVSGLIATLAATNAVFAWRLPLGAARRQFIERVRVRCLGTTPPTTVNDQEFALHVHLVTGMTANPVGNADLTVVATTLDVQRIRRTDQTPVSIVATGNTQIAGAVAVTYTGTPSAQPFLRGQGIARGATAVGNGAPALDFLSEWQPATSRHGYTDPLEGCIALATEDTGFVVLAPVAIANSLVVRIGIEIDFLEE